MSTRKGGLGVAAMVSIAVFLFLWPLTGLAQTKVPCVNVVKDSRGRPRAKLDKKQECVQYTVPQFRKVVDRLTQLRSYKKEILPACKRSNEELKRLDKSWQKAQVRWDRQVKHYGNLIGYNQKEAQEWRKAFYKLKGQKIPPRPFYDTPAFWVGVGVFATVAIVAGTAVIIHVTRPNVSTSTKALVVPYTQPILSWAQ
jgi:hypothetical protein